MNNNVSSELARLAVQLGILRIAPVGMEFPGRKGGPGKRYLVDSRGAGSNVRLRNVVVAALAERFLPLDGITTLAGLAKSGMIWAAWLAQSAGLSYATVLLDGPRAGGLQREIEGDVQARRVVLVDNWVSSGESLQTAASVVERNGGHVAAALAVSGHVRGQLPFPVLIAFSIPDLLTAAADGQLISAEELKTLLQNEK